MRWTEGYLAASQRPWRRRPRRGRSAWHAGGWVSREPGRPRRLHRKDRRGAGTGLPSPRPWTAHLASDGAKPQVLGWYRHAKATKREGMGGEESERLIVPAKRGNRVHETPWREGGLEGTMANTPRLDSVSPKRQRIAELARQASDMVPWLTTSQGHASRGLCSAERRGGGTGRTDGGRLWVNLEANLVTLDRSPASTCSRAPRPSRKYRKTRPIATFEDKVLSEPW